MAVPPPLLFLCAGMAGWKGSLFGKDSANSSRWGREDGGWLLVISALVCLVDGFGFVFGDSVALGSFYGTCAGFLPERMMHFVLYCYYKW